MLYKKIIICLAINSYFVSTYCMEDWREAIRRIDSSYNFSDGEYELDDHCLPLASLRKYREKNDVALASPKDVTVASPKAQRKNSSGESEGKIFCTHGDCARVFLKMHLLRSHQRKAHNIKSFSCTDCSDTFKYSKELRKHKHLQHGLPGMLCDLCSLFYKNERALKDHWSRKHPQFLPIKHH